MAADPQRRFSHLPGQPPAPASGELSDLLQRIGNGEEPALTRFYRATSARVFGLATRMLRDRHLAEDATLHVFERVWRAAGTYEPTRGTPLVWLLAMTRHRCLDVLRQPGREKPNADDIAALATRLGETGPSPVDLAEDRERAEAVRAAANRLPRGQREVIAAAYFGGLSQTEIARTLDLPLGTVKSRVRKGLAELRRALEELENQEP